jgi:hypothetical protein
LADVVAESGGEAAGGPERAPDAPTGTTRPADPDEGERPGRRDRLDRPGRPRARPVARPEPAGPDPKVRSVLWGWLVVFALVGGQMSWVLRPFVGMPYREFAWFRGREGSFFEGVLASLRTLLGG